MDLNEQMDALETLAQSRALSLPTERTAWLKFRVEVLNLDRRRLLAEAVATERRERIQKLQHQIAQFKNQRAADDAWEAELRTVLLLPPAHTPGTSIIDAVKALKAFLS